MRSSRADPYVAKAGAPKRNVKPKTKPVVPAQVKNEKLRSESVGRPGQKKPQETVNKRRTESVDRSSKSKQIALKTEKDEKLVKNSVYERQRGMVRNNVNRDSSRTVSQSPVKALRRSPAISNLSQNQSQEKTVRGRQNQQPIRSNVKPSPAKTRSPNIRAPQSNGRSPTVRNLTNRPGNKVSSQNGSTSSSKSRTSDRLENTVNTPSKRVTENDLRSEDEVPVRPRTSTIRKGPSVVRETDVNENFESAIPLDGNFREENNVEKASVKSDDTYSYEDDFEEYESDFDDSDSSSVQEDTQSDENSSDCSEDITTKKNIQQISGIIVHPTIVKRQQAAPPKIVEKKTRSEYLMMGSRSSTFLVEDANDTVPDPGKMRNSRSFINFASAVQNQEKQQINNKVMKRALDLFEIITLDEVSYDIADIPPMKYETYMKLFGRSNSKQISLQTDNFEDDEFQTDEIVTCEKWTQHPPYDNLGVGGEGITAASTGKDDWQSYFKAYTLKLSLFLQNVQPVVLSLLNDELSQNIIWSPAVTNKDLPFSQGCIRLQPLPFCQDSPAVFISYSVGSPAYLLSVHSSISKVHTLNPISEDKGIICVWNICNSAEPECVLTSNSQPTCACFGPLGHHTVVAGMVDGSIMLWDLTEPPSPHLLFRGQGNAIPLRSPTYNSASVLDEGGHHSCIVSIQAILYSRESKFVETENGRVQDTSKSFHVLSLEDMGILNIWVVVEVLKPDESGFDSSLGLKPGGKLRLVWSSSVSVYSLPGLPQTFEREMRAFDFQAFPSKPSHILITSDVDLVIHYSRVHGNPLPRYFSRKSGFSTEIRCICFSPHIDNLFLVGSSDGSILLFSISHSRPLLVFSQVAQGTAVKCIKWSLTHPARFYVLDNQSTLYFWDCSQSETRPQFTHRFPEPRVLWFSLYTCEQSKHKPVGVASQMALAKEDGEIEVHALQRNLDVVTEDEYKLQMTFLKSL